LYGGSILFVNQPETLAAPQFLMVSSAMDRVVVYVTDLALIDSANFDSNGWVLLAV
jgi:hypothetical protein